MNKNQAIRAAAVAACVMAFGVSAGTAEAAKKVTNPFTLTPVITTPVVVTSVPVFVPPVPQAASPFGPPPKTVPTFVPNNPTPPPAQVTGGGSPPPPPPPVF